MDPRLDKDARHYNFVQICGIRLDKGEHRHGFKRVHILKTRYDMVAMDSNIVTNLRLDIGEPPYKFERIHGSKVPS